MIAMINFLDTMISCSGHQNYLEKCNATIGAGQNFMQCNQLDCQNSFSACKNFWTCCSETNPCQIDEGDCDSDNDCTGNLRCGVANCGSMYPSNSDCCEKKGRHFVIRNDFKSKTLTIEAGCRTLKSQFFFVDQNNILLLLTK